MKERARKKNGGQQRSFSNKSFRKEINVLSKKSDRKTVLGLYENAIKQEQAKLSKKAIKRKTRAAACAAAAAAESSSSDDSSDSEMSTHVITPVRAKRRVKHPSKKRAHAKKKTTVEILDEENNYQNTVK